MLGSVGIYNKMCYIRTRWFKYMMGGRTLSKSDACVLRMQADDSSGVVKKERDVQYPL
jgi:hypothetical protein